MTLLERQEALDALAGSCASASTRGRLVWVSGEAGIGKSSLLRAFADGMGPLARVVWGYCEALATPRPFGPLLDMAESLGGETAEALAAGSAGHAVFSAFVADLARSTTPIVAVFEDVHAADEATLDLLQFVARRIGSTHAVVVISWRDDEVGADHPLHRVLGEWARADVRRIRLEPLSLAAVAQLAGGGRDAAAVHALTGGNPFFVAEVLDGVADAVPASVREAVLARRARLGAEARAVLDLLSVVPRRAELDLITSMLGEATGLEACVNAGLLQSEPKAVSFRHELSRLAVAESLPFPRVQAHHRQVLQALVARPDRAAVLARIVHHAEACGDAQAVLEHAPAAARQAASLGAHRQAADHYRLALHHGATLADEARATLREAVAYESYLTGDIEAARQANREALALWRTVGARPAIGRTTRWLSRLAWFAGDREEADRCANEAIDVLQALPGSEELAMAFSNRSQLDMMRTDVDACLAWGTRAIELAERIGAIEVVCHALNNIGAVRVMAGDVDGYGQLEKSLHLAIENDLHEHAARAYTNLVARAVERQEYAAAARWLDLGLAYSNERDLNSWAPCLLAWRARLRAETGVWQSACEDAEAVISIPRGATVHRIPALAALGLVRVRRGDPRAEDLLDEALVLARRAGELQRLVPVLLARAELAWLDGRREEVVAAAREGLAVLGTHPRPIERDALAYWLWRAGALAASEVTGDGPFALLVRGRWKAAADDWRRIGCPYERGVALLEGDVRAVQQAFEVFHGLGAASAADMARQRLRQLGSVVQVPRGPRSSTLAHPSGLTTREVEVLGLLVRGLHNSQIAERLFVSPKTVEHHVSSILSKLELQTRVDAVTHALRQGWFADIQDGRARKE